MDTSSSRLQILNCNSACGRTTERRRDVHACAVAGSISIRMCARWTNMHACPCLSLVVCTCTARTSLLSLVCTSVSCIYLRVSSCYCLTELTGVLLLGDRRKSFTNKNSRLDTVLPWSLDCPLDLKATTQPETRKRIYTIPSKYYVLTEQ